MRAQTQRDVGKSQTVIKGRGPFRTLEKACPIERRGHAHVRVPVWKGHYRGDCGADLSDGIQVEMMKDVRENKASHFPQV